MSGFFRPSPRWLIILEKTKNTERNEPDRPPSHPQPSPRLDTPYLFARQDGKPHPPTNATTAFRRAVSRAGGFPAS